MKTLLNLLSGRRKWIFLITAWALCRCAPAGGDRLENINTKAVRVAHGNDSLVKVVLREIKDTVDLNLSGFIGDLQVVQLDGRDEAFFSFTKTIVTDHYIGVLGSMNTPFKLFDRETGKFLTDIGATGRGPGEYFSIYSAQIDEGGKRIYILPWNDSKILVFDLQGNLQKHIQMPHSMPKAVFRVDPRAGRMAVGILPFKNSDSPAVLQADLEGTVLSEVPAEYLRLTPDFGNEIISGGNVPEFEFSLLTWQGRPDSLYHFIPEEKRIKPVYTVDSEYEPPVKRQESDYNSMPVEGAPIRIYHEIPDSYITSVAKIRGYSNDPPVFLRTEKKTLKTYYFNLKNDFLGGCKTWPNFEQGYYISNQEPQFVIESLDHVLANGRMSKEVRERVERLKKEIDPEGNNVIMIGKIK